MHVTIVVILAVGCGSDPAPVAPTPGDPQGYAAAFDSVWADVDRTYPYFDVKSIDWPAAGAAHRSDALRATSDSTFADVVRALLTTLRDVHVRVVSPVGASTETWRPTAVVNWDQNAWSRAVRALGWRQATTNWGWARVASAGAASTVNSSTDVGYLAFGAWNAAQVKIGEVDAALDGLRDTRVLLVDVRMNGGGDDALALQVAGRFAATRVLAERYRFRNGPGHGDFGASQERWLEPRGTWQYTRPVYLLVGRGVFSSNETFVAAMRALPNVVVLGDTTGGGSGNPSERPIRRLGRDTGWRYSLSRWIATLPSGDVIEGRGIPPARYVPWDPAAALAGRDVILEAALAELLVPAAP